MTPPRPRGDTVHSAEDTGRKIIASGAATSVSAFVIQRGGPDSGFDLVADDSPPNDRFYWTCAGKVLTVLALAVLVGDGRLSFGDPLRDRIPALDGAGWKRYSVADLMSYRVPIDGDPACLSVHIPDPAVLALINRGGLKQSQSGSRGSTYNIWTNAFLEGELIRRCSGVPPADFIRVAVVERLGLGDTELHAPDELLGEHLAPFAKDFDRERARSGISTNAPIRADRYWPGVSVTGPTSDLARALAALAWPGSAGTDGTLLSSQVVDTVRSPRGWAGSSHGSGGNDLAWGLGVITDRRIAGRRGSAGTFGLIGDNGAVIVFADIERRIVVALGLRGCVAGARTAFVRASIIDALLRDFELQRATA